MGQFVTSGVRLHHRPGHSNAVLMAPVIYIDNHNRRHTAHPGLLVDGRSGKIFYYLIGTPYDPRHLEATVIHDWYCAKAKTLTGAARRVLRARGDELFMECLEAVGESQWKQRVMPWVVRRQAWIHRNDPVAHWSEDFISEEASHMGTVKIGG